MSAAARESVLLVDDEPQVLVALQDLLSDEFTVLKADGPAQALDIVDRVANLAVLITDQRMPGMNGDELLSRLEGRTRATRLLLTGFADLTAVVRAVNEGRIFAYIGKPWHAEDLRLKVQRAAEHFRLAQELELERQLLADLMDSMPDGIYFKDAELRFLRANRALLERLERTPSELVGRRLRDLIPSQQAERIEREEGKLLAGGAPLLDVVRPELRRGEERWYSESKAPIRKRANGEVVGIVGISRDVTQRQAQEARIARLTSVRSLISGINSAIVRTHDRDQLLKAVCRIAITASELTLAVVARITLPSAEVRIVASEPHDATIVEELERMLVGGRHDSPLLRQLFVTPQPVIINDIAAATQLRYRDLMLAHGLGSVAVMPLVSAGQIDSVFCLFSKRSGFFDTEEAALLRDVTDNISHALEHIAKTERLAFLAYHDDLTRLPNRDLLLDRTGQLLAARRADGRALAMLVVDLDRFRQVNETLGREGGDALLVQVARRLQGAMKEGGSVARVFGNTFAILLPQVDSEASVASLVENELLSEVRKGVLVDGTEVPVSARIGIALFPSDGDTAASLLANAEAASKRAKATGRAYVFYAPSMNAQVAEKMALEAKLRRAVERDEFLLHYQPKIDLRTGRVVGLEALIRWRDPDAGLVPPGMFIPLLEETGLIREVGQWVFERAARQYGEWKRAGLAPPRIAVNVSALQLAANDFVEGLERVLRHHGLDGAGIDLEITESVFVDDLAGSITKLQLAQGLGLTIAMDDFGTGYSSLSSIGRLPLDSLKVDQSFVKNMLDNPQSTSIVTTIISLAHALNLTVVAEGVETMEQAQLLRLLKCDQAQGYLIARPMPAEQAAAALGMQFEVSSRSGRP